MLKLVYSGNENYKWAYKDNSQIYSKVVWLIEKIDANKYHLIDENRDEIKVNVEDYIIDE